MEFLNFTTLYHFLRIKESELRNTYCTQNSNTVANCWTTELLDYRTVGPLLQRTLKITHFIFFFEVRYIWTKSTHFEKNVFKVR